jgi:methylmalonyl-CoA mutase
VEKLTRDLAEAAWAKMQAIEAKGGIIAAHFDGLWREFADARAARQERFNTRRETITGVSDFPLLDAAMPEFESFSAGPAGPFEGKVNLLDSHGPTLMPIRWAAPFERLRDTMETRKPRPAIFFATLGPLAQFGARAQFARNLFAAGGIASAGEEEEYASRDQMIDAFRAQAARVAVICGTDSAYAEAAENAAQRLKAAGAHWIVLAGKAGERENALREAGVDQFVYVGQDAVAELETLHAALGAGG